MSKQKRKIERPKLWSVRGIFWLFIFLLMCMVPVLVFGGAFAQFYVNGKEEWQDERTCTITTAYKYSSSGGFRMGGSSAYTMVETPDCGRIGLDGTLNGKTVEETAQYLDAHQGEQFRFYFGKIQLSRTLTEAERVEEIN